MQHQLLVLSTLQSETEQLGTLRVELVFIGTRRDQRTVFHATSHTVTFGVPHRHVWAITLVLSEVRQSLGKPRFFDSLKYGYEKVKLMIADLLPLSFPSSPAGEYHKHPPSVNNFVGRYCEKTFFKRVVLLVVAALEKRIRGSSRANTDRHQDPFLGTEDPGARINSAGR